MRTEQEFGRDTPSNDEPVADSVAPAFGLGDLDAIIGVHVGFANSAIVKNFLQTLAPLALTPKQTSILWLVSENSEISKADLARVLKVERATMQAMVNSLLERALLVHEPAAHDGRKVRIRLTETGRQVLTEAQALVRSHEDWIKGKFSAEEIALVQRLMRRIYE